MEHSVEAYLKRLPTEKLEEFLQEYMGRKQEEDFTNVIGDVVHELARRKETGYADDAQ